MKWAFLACMAVVFVTGLWLFSHVDEFWWRVPLSGAYGLLCCTFAERFGKVMGWWDSGTEEP